MSERDAGGMLDRENEAACDYGCPECPGQRAEIAALRARLENKREGNEIMRLKMRVKTITEATIYRNTPDMGLAESELGLSVIIEAVRDGSKENRIYGDATPSGTLQFTAARSAFPDGFLPGSEVYLDLSMLREGENE